MNEKATSSNPRQAAQLMEYVGAMDRTQKPCPKCGLQHTYGYDSDIHGHLITCRVCGYYELHPGRGRESKVVRSGGLGVGVTIGRVPGMGMTRFNNTEMRQAFVRNIEQVNPIRAYLHIQGEDGVWHVLYLVGEPQDAEPLNYPGKRPDA